MQITITINTCHDCRYLDHSGSFTLGGALPVCIHRGACYGSHASVTAGASVKDVMIQHGMALGSAELYEKNAIKNNDGEVELILLRNYQPGDCLHWIHRVPYSDWGKPSIPDWCPLKSGARY